MSGERALFQFLPFGAAAGSTPAETRVSKQGGGPDLPWSERTAPNRVRPRECVGNAREALDRAYAITDKAAIPLLIEALDWLRRALEQMAVEE